MQEAINAQKTKNELLKITEEQRNLALKNIAKLLESNINNIIIENKKDLESAREQNLSQALIDRLKLDETRIRGIISSVEAIALQPQVVGEIVESTTRQDGLIINKQRIPIGVIGMIFESRPNVVIDCSCLAIKSGNSIILKGGKEAHHSNLALVKIVKDAIKDILPYNSVQLISTREDVSNLLKQSKYIDVIIPRGGEKLIEYVYENSLIPVIAHFKGLCHIFIDKDYPLNQAIDICLNAKTQRPGVCNAMETLLIHKEYPKQNIINLLENLKQKQTELRLDQELLNIYPGGKLASEQDWATEYLDNILSVKLISSVDEAISHIQKYGSNHTEAILSNSPKNIEKFQNEIDASSIMINASTRFNDGGEYGLGAELGISTTKLHAYGPMGAKEMTTLRFLVKGNGNIRN